jgi:hypothetical protein
MTHVQQPKGSRLCGQSCVAIVAGITLADAIRVTTAGKDRASSARDIRAGLEAASGFGLNEFFTWHRSHAPASSLPWHRRPLIARLRWVARRDGYHWIVIDDSIVHDPAFCYPVTRLEYERWLYRSIAYVSSYSPILPLETRE